MHRILVLILGFAAAGWLSADERQLELAVPFTDNMILQAKVPIFHIHGDMDRVVPLDTNSAIIKKRYDALGGPMTLEVVKGQGHSMWNGWFQSQKLVDFVIKHAKNPSSPSFKTNP